MKERGAQAQAGPVRRDHPGGDAGVPARLELPTLGDTSSEEGYCEDRVGHLAAGGVPRLRNQVCQEEGQHPGRGG